MADLDNNWFQTWPDGLLGLSKHSRIVELSPVAQSILGWSREELYGEHPHSVLCIDKRGYQHELSDCPLAFADQASDITSALWRHKNGHDISVDFRLIAVGFDEATRIISFVDNSTRLHNQAELEKFSEYVEMSPAPLAEFVMDGQLLFGNAALQDLLLEYGFDDKGAAQALPKNIREIGDRILASEDGVATTEVRLGKRVFSWHFHLLHTNNEASMVGYAFDVTAQKEAEALAARQQALARKEFYAKMVHELRSPLNAIVGFSDLLAANLRGSISETDFRRLKMIKEAGVQLNEQVTATLDLTKIESGKMSLDISEFAIDELCQDVFDQFCELGQSKGLDMRLSNYTRQRIFSDRTKVRQIIVNLLSNAIKYTKLGEVSLVSTAADDRELGECISILVSDTGIGIEADKVPRLFKSFEQVTNSQTRGIEGTGLGLALVANLVKLIGGKIQLESEHGAGSQFEVLIPFLSSDSMSTADELGLS